MVVLSEDILNIDPAQIEHTKVEMTIFDGKVVYETGKSGEGGARRSASTP